MVPGAAPADRVYAVLRGTTPNAHVEVVAGHCATYPLLLARYQTCL